MKYFLSLLGLGACLLFFSGCQSRVFGVDEEVWATLSESQREKVIEGYNKRKEIQLAGAHKRKERELQLFERQQEIDAQTAPFYAAADAFSLFWGPGKEERLSSLRITSLSKDFGTRVIVIGDTRFEVSPFTKMSDAWLKGQRVKLLKNEESLLYSVTVRNLDNGENIYVRKAR